MSERGNNTVDIEIFGSTYPVRADADSGQVLELARTVDRTMRNIAGKVRTTDRSAIAVLAALNLADELFRSQKQLEGERAATADKLAELTARLETALRGESASGS
jgi:cell division protein ZapA